MKPELRHWECLYCHATWQDQAGERGNMARFAGGCLACGSKYWREVKADE